MRVMSILQYLLLSVAIIISLWQVSFQLKGQFAEGSYESLSEIKAVVAQDDLLLIPLGEIMFREQIVPSLDTFFDIETFKIRNVADLIFEYDEFAPFLHGYRTVYVLSQGRIGGSLSQMLTLEKDIVFRKGNFGASRDIPRSYEVGKLGLSLYKLDFQVYASKRDEILRRTLERSRGEIDGLTGDGWTQGCAEIASGFDLSNGYTRVAIVLNGWRPHWNDVGMIKPVVRINGKALSFTNKTDRGYVFELGGVMHVKAMEVCSETFVPRELGINNDGRSLGLDIKSVRFW